jgi:transcriptional regulator with XRE-family HTH domain
MKPVSVDNRISPEDFRTMFADIRQPKPTMSNVAHTFGDMLQRLRVKAGLTLRELEDLSGVQNPIISMIERGKRRCGANVAAKFADALFVQECGAKREFLYAAAATIKARGAIEDSQLYPPAVLDVVASKLKKMGVRDRDILAVHVESPDKNEDKRDLLIVLHGGKRLTVTVTIKEAP